MGGNNNIDKNKNKKFPRNNKNTNNNNAKDLQSKPNRNDEVFVSLLNQHLNIKSNCNMDSSFLSDNELCEIELSGKFGQYTIRRISNTNLNDFDYVCPSDYNSGIFVESPRRNYFICIRDIVLKRLIINQF